MDNRNPYIPSAVRPPARRYTIRFIDEQQREHIVQVDPAKLPYGSHGLPGSILDIALGHAIPLEHACGGVCACSTCHVIIRQGLGACNEPTEAEQEQLDEAYGLTPLSRLGCQCVPTGEEDLIVEIPAWNRNLAREAT